MYGISFPFYIPIPGVPAEWCQSITAIGIVVAFVFLADFFSEMSGT